MRNRTAYVDVEYFRHLKSDYNSAEYSSKHDPFVEDDVIKDGGDDPQYSLFLSNLVKDGSSYVLKDNEETGLIKPLKYEEYESEEEEEDDDDDEGEEDFERLLEMDDDYAHFREGNRVEGEKVLEPLSGIDEDYAVFREGLRVEGSNVIWQYYDCLPVLFENLELPNFPKDDGRTARKRKSKQSIDSTSSDGSEEEESSHCSKDCSKFRVQVMRILSKPYDKQEHKKLMQAITVRKPQHKHKDLRSGAVRFYKSDKMGKSLLDQHGSLKLKVEAAAKDDLKQLNLFRGFFFWLQNLTREGSFMPWNDDECLAVQPQVCAKLDSTERFEGSNAVNQCKASNAQVNQSWNHMGCEEKTATVHQEICKMNKLPSNSSYASHRLRVLNKILHLLSTQRTTSQDEELELLFAGLSI